MSIVQFTRFKSDKAEEMVKTAKEAKTIFEKHGAEFLRLSRFHTGVWAGDWLIATRYSSWEVYGKVQEGVAKDPAFEAKFRDTVDKLDAVIDKVNSGQGTIGQLLVNPSVYNNADAMLSETRNLVTQIRENPKKYLTFHVKVF